MTIKQTLKAINALPNMRAIYKSEYKEFQVILVGRPEADYYTEDRDDALATARDMSTYGPAGSLIIFQTTL